MLDDEKIVKKEIIDEWGAAIQDILTSNKDTLKKATMEMVREELLAKIKWQIADPVNECIEEFMRKEIKPEIEKYLISSKPQILAGMANIINEIGEAVKVTLSKKAAENLVSGWKMDKLIEALFK